MAFLLPIRNEEIFVYMNNRDSSQCIATHIANMPQGIAHFENWFQSGLLKFVSGILNDLKKTIPADKVFLTFAQFLDNKDFDLFIRKSKFNEQEEKNIKNSFSLLLLSSEFDLVMQGMACLYLDLNNAAKSLLKLWIQSLWFDGDEIQNILDEAKAILTIRNNAAKAGSIGASTRWAPRNKTQSYAIDLMLEGNYKNASRAASSIKQQVIVYGESVGFRFSDDDRAYTTIYKWLRTHINKQKY